MTSRGAFDRWRQFARTSGATAPKAAWRGAFGQPSMLQKERSRLSADPVSAALAHFAGLPDGDRSVLMKLSVLRWFDRGLYEHVHAGVRSPDFSQVISWPTVELVSHSAEPRRYTVVPQLREGLAAELSSTRASDYIAINKLAADYFHHPLTDLEPAHFGDLIEEVGYLAVAAPEQGSDRLAAFAVATLTSGHPDVAALAARAVQSTEAVPPVSAVVVVARLIDALAAVIAAAGTGRATSEPLMSAVEAVPSPQSDVEEALLELAHQALDHVLDSQPRVVDAATARQHEAELERETTRLALQQAADFAEFGHRCRVPSLAGDPPVAGSESITAVVAGTVAHLLCVEANGMSVLGPQELTHRLLEELAAPALAHHDDFSVLAPPSDRNRRMLLAVEDADSEERPDTWLIQVPSAAPQLWGRADSADDWIWDDTRERGRFATAVTPHEEDDRTDTVRQTAAVISGGTSTIARGRPYLSLDDLLSYAREAAFRSRMRADDPRSAGRGMRAASNLEIVVLLAPRLGRGVWVDVDPATGQPAATLSIALHDEVAIRVTQTPVLVGRTVSVRGDGQQE